MRDRHFFPKTEAANDNAYYIFAVGDDKWCEGVDKHGNHQPLILLSAIAGNAGVSPASANHEHKHTKNVDEKAERRPLVQAGRLRSRDGVRNCRAIVS